MGLGVACSCQARGIGIGKVQSGVASKEILLKVEGRSVSGMWEEEDR